MRFSRHRMEHRSRPAPARSSLDLLPGQSSRPEERRVDSQSARLRVATPRSAVLPILRESTRRRIVTTPTGGCIRISLTSSVRPGRRSWRIDLNRGTIKWRVPLGEDARAVKEGAKDAGVFMAERHGMIVTSTGLLFIATTDGKVRAHDEETGKVLWTADTASRLGRVAGDVRGERPPISRGSRLVEDQHRRRSPDPRY